MLHHLQAEPTAPRRVVVIGAGGFVGGAVCRRLAVAGIPFMALTRADVDLSTPAAADVLKARLQAGDAVVAAAAHAPCRNLDMLIENLVISKALVAAIGATDVVHVVNVSSDAVYADAPLPLTEASPMAPASYHGVMHLAREVAFQNEIGVPLAIVRPTLIYGRDDPHNGYGPNRFCRLTASGEDIVLFGAGEERRDHVLIDDVAEIIVRIVLRRSTGVLNIATGETYSFRAIADLVAEMSGLAVAIKETVRNGPMPHGGYRSFDIAATRTAFPDFDYVKLPTGVRGMCGTPIEVLDG